jgi:hypothetical protein
VLDAKPHGLRCALDSLGGLSNSVRVALAAEGDHVGVGRASLALGVVAVARRRRRASSIRSMTVMSIQRWMRGVAGLIVCLGVVGCMGTTRIVAPTRPDAKGKPVAFERRERNVTRDWLHHVARRAYYRSGFFLGFADSPDQWSVLNANGRPELARLTFVSEDHELVKEWLYPSKKKMYQFIGGQLAYQGPISDYARILREQGYPDKIIVDESDQRRRTDEFIYSGWFLPSLQTYHFFNGKLILSQTEGN